MSSVSLPCIPQPGHDADDPSEEPELDQVQQHKNSVNVTLTSDKSKVLKPEFMVWCADCNKQIMNRGIGNTHKKNMHGGVQL